MDLGLRGPPKPPPQPTPPTPVYSCWAKLDKFIHCRLLLNLRFVFILASETAPRPPLLPPWRVTRRLRGLPIATWQQVRDKNQGCSLFYLKGLPLNVLHLRLVSSCYDFLLGFISISVRSRRSAFSYFGFLWPLTLALTRLSGCSTSSKDSVVLYFCCFAKFSLLASERPSQVAKMKFHPGKYKEKTKKQTISQCLQSVKLKWSFSAFDYEEDAERNTSPLSRTVS